MLNSILLVIIVVLSAFCAVLFWQIKEKVTINIGDLRYRVNESINAVLMEENKKLAEKYAQVYEAECFFKERLEKEDFSFSDFADNVGQRAIILAIKKAEESVATEEENLRHIRNTISEVQKRLDIHIAHSSVDSFGMTNRDEKALQALAEREKYAKQRLEEAQAYLRKLVEKIKKDQPKS